MKIDTIQPNLNLKSFYEFAKLDLEQQSALLSSEGVFLDLDSEKQTLTKLYFLKGFFVEEITCRKHNRVMQIIPYKQGYRIENYIEIKRFGGKSITRSTLLN